MRRTAFVLLLWLCTTCVLTTVHGRSIPWLIDTSPTRAKKRIDLANSLHCQMDSANCENMGWGALNNFRRPRRTKDSSRSKRRLADLLHLQPVSHKANPQALSE